MNKIKTKLLIKISTFGRPSMLFNCLDSFAKNLSGLHSVFFCVTCNSDDETMDAEVVDKLKSLYPNLEVFFGDYKSKIEAYNADIEKFDFDVLILASDDMEVVHKNYDRLVLKKMYNGFPDLDGVLWFETGDGNKITDTLSIMGSSFYKRFGYAYKSQYMGYYCDDEFTQVAFKLGKIKRIEIEIIRHKLPHNLRMSEDSTYLKSLVHGTKDKALYKIRKKVQFDIPGVVPCKNADLQIQFFEESRNKGQNLWNADFPKFDDPISALEIYILEGMDRKVAAMGVGEFISFARRYFMDFRWTIPKTIHQIWFGEIPSKVKEFMATFSVDYINKNPGWRYIFWDEKRLRSLEMLNKDIFESENGLDCKSDIARLEILNRFGGFYVDSDCVWLGRRSLDVVPDRNGIMIAYEKDGESIGKGLLGKHAKRCANTVFGSTIANPIVAFLIGRLRSSHAANRHAGAVSSTGPDFVQGVIDSLGGLVEVNSHKYFYPKWWCADPKRNPEYEEFMSQRNMSSSELAALYPDAVLFHRGFTSNEEAS